MKIIYIHQYFRTPEMHGGTHSYDIASRLVREGHEVIMLTINTTNKKSGKNFLFENINGIKVYWLPGYYSSKMSFIRKILSFIEFMFNSTFLLIKLKCDLVFATSTPLTIGVPALIKKKIHRTPFIFEVRDLWPAVPIEMGILKNKLIIRILYYFEKLIYNNSEKIFVISEGIKDLINAPKEKIKIFPFGCDLKKFESIENYSFKEENNLNDKIVIGLVGSIGYANDPYIILETAKILKKIGNADIHFVFIGEGSIKTDISRIIKNENLTNVTLHDSISKKRVLSVIKSIDAGLILHGKSRIYRYTASPNKFFDYLVAGLPIIYNFTGPLKNLLIKNDVGHYFDYDDPESLAKFLHTLNMDDLLKRSENGKRLAQTNFNIENIFNELNMEIVKLIQ